MSEEFWYDIERLQARRAGNFGQLVIRLVVLAMPLNNVFFASTSSSRAVDWDSHRHFCDRGAVAGKSLPSSENLLRQGLELSTMKKHPAAVLPRKTWRQGA